MENSQLSSKLNNQQNEFADRLDRLKSSQQLLDAVKEVCSLFNFLKPFRLLIKFQQFPWMIWKY
jgi:hypothetical protein